MKPGQVVVLKENFETKTITKTVNGKETTEQVPKYKQGQSFVVVAMDLFWMSPEEKGGVAVDLGPMDYVRLTYPDGTKTKYFDLFTLKDSN